MHNSIIGNEIVNESYSVDEPAGAYLSPEYLGNLALVGFFCQGTTVRLIFRVASLSNFYFGLNLTGTAFNVANYGDGYFIPLSSPLTFIDEPGAIVVPFAADATATTLQNGVISVESSNDNPKLIYVFINSSADGIATTVSNEVWTVNFTDGKYTLLDQSGSELTSTADIVANLNNKISV